MLDSSPQIDVLEYEYERPWLYPKQLEAIFDAKDLDGNPARYAYVEASTKAGKTVACIAWLFEQALQGKLGDNFWWVAPVYTQAKIAFRRMKNGIPRGLYRANESEMTITLIHGPVIWFKSGEKPDNLYGEDVRAAVVDEASRVREDAWHAVRSVITATKGKVRAIGNVKGRKNWFYKHCRRAQSGEKDNAFAKLNAWDAVAGGVLDREEIEDAKRMLPENVFNELYLAEASDDEGNPFGHKHIQACIGPFSSRPPVAIGVDLAKSVDWTVVIGIDRNGAVCGLERWQRVPWDETTRRILSMVKGVPALIDSTGVGDPIVETMQSRNPRVDGFKFTSESKQRLMEGLAMALQSRQITIPKGVLVDELNEFEYVYTRTGVRYSAPDGFHDDCVVALALAVQKWREVRPALNSNKPVSIPRISPFLDFDATSEGALV